MKRASYELCHNMPQQFVECVLVGRLASSCDVFPIICRMCVYAMNMKHAMQILEARDFPSYGLIVMKCTGNI
jgi:hypothetical protein